MTSPAARPGGTRTVNPRAEMSVILTSRSRRDRAADDFRAWRCNRAAYLPRWRLGSMPTPLPSSEGGQVESGRVRERKGVR
jgi:hypothetical protein